MGRAVRRPHRTPRACRNPSHSRPRRSSQEGPSEAPVWIFLSDHFEGQSDPLAAADAHRGDTSPETVPTHRMEEAGRQHSACCTDRMTMCDGATLDIHNVRRQPEFLHDRERYDGEGLVDFNTLDVAMAPVGARQRLFDGGDRTEA